MTNHPNRSTKAKRYQVRASGYITRGVCGTPGDPGAGYRPHKFISDHETRQEAEAACMEARRPSETVAGTNSTWQIIEDAYVYDRHANWRR